MKNVDYLIVGSKYKITHVVYDDYDEKLEPESEIVEVIKKNRTGYVLKNMEFNYSYEITFSMLLDCEIENI